MSEHLGVPNISDISAIFHRRKIPVLIAITVVMAISAYFAITPPSIYRSTAQIQIERQELSEDLVTSSGNEYGLDEIGASTKQVMTRDNLERIIVNFDLYPELRTDNSAESLIGKLQSNIHVNTITEERIHEKTGRPLLEAVAFNVSFDDQSPEKAQEVAAELASLYLTVNRQRRTERAEGASAFLASEADRLNKSISNLEQELSAFKKENTFMLPEYGNYNLQLIERTRTEIERQQVRIDALQEKRTLLDSQTGTEAVIDPLVAAQEELAQALQKYTQQHPKVLTLKRAIANMEAQRASGQGYSAPRPLDQLSIRIADQRRAVNLELSEAESQLQELQKNLEEYELRLAKSPEVERRFLSLSRDYDNALKKYSELRDKEMEARLAEQLEREQKGDRFTMLQPPAVPSEPIAPNRPGILSLGLAISLLGSFILASFLEYLDPTVRGVEGVKSALKAPPLGVVPYIAK